MKRGSGIAKRLRAGAARWRRRALAVLMALAGAAPGAAHPLTLEQLLELPLERLLKLNISARLTIGDAPPPASRRSLTASRHAD